MIEISYDRNMLEQVERRLGRMKSEAPKALKNAIPDSQAGQEGPGDRSAENLYRKNRALQQGNED